MYLAKVQWSDFIQPMSEADVKDSSHLKKDGDEWIVLSPFTTLQEKEKIPIHFHFTCYEKRVTLLTTSFPHLLPMMYQRTGKISKTFFFSLADENEPYENR